MKGKDKSFMENVLASIENIENKTQELDYHRFLEDVEAQRVVARELDPLSGVLEICPDGSFQDVDLLLVWYIVHKRVPELRERVISSLF
jgi:uncharacterized protein with HEPN domain